MRWRFVGYAVAGYLTVWVLAAYVAVALAVKGDPVDVRSFISFALLFSPIGILPAPVIEAERR